MLRSNCFFDLVIQNHHYSLQLWIGTIIYSFDIMYMFVLILTLLWCFCPFPYIVWIFISWYVPTIFHILSNYLFMTVGANFYMPYDMYCRTLPYYIILGLQVQIWLNFLQNALFVHAMTVHVISLEVLIRCFSRIIKVPCW